MKNTDKKALNQEIDKQIEKTASVLSLYAQASLNCQKPVRALLNYTMRVYPRFYITPDFHSDKNSLFFWKKK